MRVTLLTDADVEATVALWQACELTRPWNDAAADIAQARKGDNADILLGRNEQGTLVASVMVGHDGHRGWVYYVAVDPSTRGKGYGRAIMEAAEEWLRQRGILKLMLMVRPDNTKVQAFYESIGYDTQPRAIYAKWLDGREMTP
jgi:ribosomal protein S18 acetylase RimI-like enzyme